MSFLARNDYLKLSQEKEKEIQENLGFVVKEAIRRNPERDRARLTRPCYVRDIEKILHHPYYNRYTDKTQVFSFFKDDDITRRALHVQLVSRIARNIGRLLGLDLDLIEAIALGHDMGHTPFGHAGEKLLGDIYHARTGRYFNHNVHSVRVLDNIFNLNISLDTLDGILSHNGELELQEYKPCKLSSFAEFDKKVEMCYTDRDGVKKLIPSTLEGCVVRVSDIIAYIGKDRQDAERVGVDVKFSGSDNSYMINNFIINIVENSFGKDYIKMDEEYFEAFKRAKEDNYKTIYLSQDVNTQYKTCLQPMFEMLYNKLLSQYGDENSLLHRHQIDYVNRRRGYYQNGADYREENTVDDIVVDYIASMTDDYFIDICAHLLPDAPTVHYVGYFDSKGKE